MWFKKRKRKKICKTVDIESFKVHLFLFILFLYLLFLTLFVPAGV